MSVGVADVGLEKVRPPSAAGAAEALPAEELVKTPATRPVVAYPRRKGDTAGQGRANWHRFSRLTCCLSGQWSSATAQNHSFRWFVPLRRHVGAAPVWWATAPHRTGWRLEASANPVDMAMQAVSTAARPARPATMLRRQARRSGVVRTRTPSIRRPRRGGDRRARVDAGQSASCAEHGGNDQGQTDSEAREAHDGDTHSMAEESDDEPDGRDCRQALGQLLRRNRQRRRRLPTTGCSPLPGQRRCSRGGRTVELDCRGPRR